LTAAISFITVYVFLAAVCCVISLLVTALMQAGFGHNASRARMQAGRHSPQRLGEHDMLLLQQPLSGAGWWLLFSQQQDAIRLTGAKLQR